MSQLSSTRLGGSYARTRAQRQTLPSTPRSYRLPPTRGSNTVSAISTPSMLWSGGLKLPKSSVKTLNARSIGASTTTEVFTVVSVTWVLIRSPRWLLDDRLEGRQRLVPKPVELGPQCGQPLGVDLVDALLAGPDVDDEAGVLQDLEVLRDRGPADRQITGQLADRARALRQPLEDRAPGRVGEHCPAALRVSHH